MAAGRLRGEFALPVDEATAAFTDELDDLSSVRYSVEREGNAATVSVGFVELATWVYPTIAALLGLVLAAFLVPDTSLPSFLNRLEPLWGFQRWWALVFTAVMLVVCYLLSQVTAVIPGGEISITPDGNDASNVEVRDVSEPYMYRALRNVVHKYDRHHAAARAEAEANQLTLGSVFGMGALGMAGFGRGSERAASASSDTNAAEPSHAETPPLAVGDGVAPPQVDDGAAPPPVGADTPPLAAEDGAPNGANVEPVEVVEVTEVVVVDEQPGADDT